MLYGNIYDMESSDIDMYYRTEQGRSFNIDLFTWHSIPNIILKTITENKHTIKQLKYAHPIVYPLWG